MIDPGSLHRTGMEVDPDAWTSGRALPDEPSPVLDMFTLECVAWSGCVALQAGTGCITARSDVDATPKSPSRVLLRGPLW
jgi:hypothetical protein